MDPMDRHTKLDDEGRASAPDDLREILAQRSRARRSPLTTALIALALVAVGVLGGVVVGRSTGDTGSAAGIPDGLIPSGATGGVPNGGSGAGGGGFPGGGNVTLGTISSVSGDTITLQTANGGTVTVRVGDGTQIQITTDGSIGDLAEGDSIVVAGSQSGDTVDATSITEGGGLAGGPAGASG